MAGIEPVSNVRDQQGVCMILFGYSGVGKTPFAASAQDSPYGRNVLIMDIEGGVRSIANREDIKRFPMTDYKDFNDAFEFLTSKEGKDYKTIVFDSLTETQKLSLTGIVNTERKGDTRVADGVPNMQDWLINTEQIRKFVRTWRDFGNQNGVNVIFTALAGEMKDEVSGAVQIQPLLTPRLTLEVPGFVDIVAYMDVGANGRRDIHLEPGRARFAYYAKMRRDPGLPEIPRHFEVKLRADGRLYPAMPELLNTLRGSEPWPEDAGTGSGATASAVAKA